jgi:hypothetical protein
MFRALAVAVVVAAISAPAAAARHAPDDVASPLSRASSASTAGDQSDARLGPKYVSLPHSSGVNSAAVPTARSGSAGTFPYRLVVIPIAAVLLALGAFGMWRSIPHGWTARRLSVDE